MKEIINDHYNINRYLNKKNWYDYYYQFHQTIIFNPENCLIIGIGDGITPHLLKKYIDVTTFDVNKDLKPDILGDVRNITDFFPDKKFDIIICCEVLEHIDYDDFLKVIKELSIIGKYLILSLPYQYLGIKVSFRITPFQKDEKSFILGIPYFFKKFKPTSEHLWEIGFKGYPLKTILNEIKKYYLIENTFRVIYNPQHFFITAVSKNCISKRK